MSTNTFASWFKSISCCGVDEKDRPTESGSGLGILTERKIVVLRDQPAPTAPPAAEPIWASEQTYAKTSARERDWPRDTASPHPNSAATMKHWFSRKPSSRRLKISGPTNFRHLHSESFQYPSPAPAPASRPRPRPRPRSFRPLELSIYTPSNRLTPILPHLDVGDEFDFIAPPPRAHTANSSRWDASSSTTLAPDRSYSVLSFHIPRKHVRQSSGDSDLTLSPPRIPPKSRARASTAPNTERIVTRIADAMLEKERLQTEINNVVERQSIYFNSRPSTAYSMRGSDLTPMPSIPALPPAAPSFAERLSVDTIARPTTAPARVTSTLPAKENARELAQAAFHSHPPYSPSKYDDEMEDEASDLDRPLAPPLPLTLRPPLRKKKSFSRVSHWLDSNLSKVDEASPSPTGTTATFITTSPRPIKETDGFYQCVAPPEGLPRTSMETSSSVYTFESSTTEDGGDGAKTAATTTYTPGSSPTVKQTASSSPQMPERKTFDGMGAGLIPARRLELAVPVGGVAGGIMGRPLSVGVAF
ncbi:hypothetical protein QBC42DRAFT_268282 [Cladorrhinum samala]|uniref:Uncharacterized protein n=1 Tax=Cladorrhinum samala TaxID=585594 RepID=A0AAV9HQD0_9PEZI|nr:hypothetical protein QBC42DRAFT_268282 [Cladorrhinum samala]